MMTQTLAEATVCCRVDIDVKKINKYDTIQGENTNVGIEIIPHRRFI